MKSNVPLSRIRSTILLSWLGAVLGLWVPPGAQAQTCTLTSPTNGATSAAPGNIPAAAVCTPAPDGGSIAYVSFVVDGVSAANIIAPPYSCLLSNLSPGTVTLQAVLWDNEGFPFPSDPVSVTVTGPPVSAPAVVFSNPNLVLWLVASNAITDGNGNVTNWADQSGYGNDAGLPDFGNPPTLATNAVNGLPALSFESGNFCSLAVPASPLLDTTNEMASFVVLRPTTNNAGSFMELWWQGFGFPTPNCFSLQAGQSEIYPWPDDWTSLVGWGDGTTETHVDANESVPASQWCIMGFNKVSQTTSNKVSQPGQPVWQLTTQYFISHFLNGIPNGGPTLVTGPIGNLSSLGSPTYIGAHGDYDSNYFFGGQIAELMIFDAALTGTNLDNLQAYLGSKYGIALSLPPPDPGPVVSMTPTNGSDVPGYTNWFVTVDPTPAPGTGTTIASVDLQYSNWYSFGVWSDIGTLTAPPYQWLGLGYSAQEPYPYSFMAIVTDSRGVTTTANISVHAVGAPASCVVTGPANGATFVAPASITVTATASELDPGYTVATMGFLANGNPVANLIAPPYAVELTALNPGTLTLQAFLTDDLGFATTSAPVTVTITGPTNNFTGASNLVLWLEANQGVTGFGGNVGNWADQSTYGNSASSEGYDPRFINDATNNQPAVAFDSTNTTYLEVNDSSNLAITGDIAGFAVINVPVADWVDEPMIWFEGGDGGNGNFPNGNNGVPSPNGLYIAGPTYYSGGQLLQDGGWPVFVRGDGTNYEDVFTGINPLPASGYAIVGFNMTNGAMTQYLNGAFNGAGTASGAFAYADNDKQALFIGARGCLDNTYLTGNIAELMIFNTSLSMANLTSIETYLGDKYGIELAAPVPDAGPAVSITSPTNGAAEGLNFVVTAAVTPATNTGLVSVELFANGASVGTLTNAPWQWSENGFAAPPVTLTVTATDNHGVSNSDTSTIFVPGDLVRNGGFEESTNFFDWGGTISDWTLDINTNLPGNLGAVVFNGQLHSGTNALGVIMGGSPAYISQTLATTAGTTYQISFWVQEWSGFPNAATVLWNGAAILNITNILIDFQSNNGWTNILAEATATSDPTTLGLGILGVGGWVFVDDFMVVPVPLAGPTLGIAFQSNSLVITWPPAYTGYTLQSATNLSGSWAPVSGVETNQITVTPSLTQQFYRLVSP
jgi:hypothetical protein